MSHTTLYASCQVGGLRVGINVDAVQEVTAGTDLTRIPLASPLISGLLNLRGQIVTAIDLRRCLHLAERPAGQRPVNVILRTADGCVSLLVDDVGDVLAADADCFEEPPRTLRGRLRELISGAYQLDGGLLLTLDIEGVLAFSAGDRV
jgi:purine-binding chemotaxis protein CheW